MLFKKKKNKSIRVIDYMQDMRMRRNISPSYRSQIKNAINYLIKYENHTKRKLMSNDFTLLRAEDFVVYLINQKLKKNTALKYSSRVFSALNRMQREGYDVDTSYSELKLKYDETNAIALTNEDLDAIYNLKLNNNLSIVRDLFLVGCYTGLRYSDYSRLDDSVITNDTITIKTKKTDTIVCIPLHPRVKEILRKHKGTIRYKESQANFNAALKRIAKRAEIKEKILIEYSFEGRIIRERMPKYALVSSHTARRTFATNAYISGIQTARIMLLTGHKTEAAFFKYIRIQKQENAMLLSEHPFFRD